MASVVTLVGKLDEAIVAEACSLLNRAGAETADPNWIETGEALDIPFDGLEHVEAHQALLTADLPLDHAVQGRQGRRKKLLVADMDSTIVTTETLDDLAAFVGLKEKIAAITARAMAGELEFEPALRERVGLLAGMPESRLEEAYAEVVLSKGAETLVRTMAAKGAFCALVSGGFDFFTSRVRARCGFDLDVSNRLEIAEGALTGQVLDPIVTKETKLEQLKTLSAERGFGPAEAVTVGDGANDLPMLEAAGLGVAYQGKPLLREATRARVDHTDLTALLFFQGYARADFVEA
ncbi:MAG: phosphoserine phosphatase SerB [Magnetovibrionaceae bacterium]